MLLILLAVVSQIEQPWPDANQLKRYQQNAEFRKSALPAAKASRVKLAIPDPQVTFIVWEPPANIRTARPPIDFRPKSANVQSEFAEWSALMAGSRRLYITYFEFEEQAEAFDAKWLSALRNKQGGASKRIKGDASVIWGDWFLIDKL